MATVFAAVSAAMTAVVLVAMDADALLAVIAPTAVCEIAIVSANLVHSAEAAAACGYWPAE